MDKGDCVLGRRRPPSQRIGCDIGGTFTDFALWDDDTGRVQVHKVLTTPKAPWSAVLGGMDDLVRENSVQQMLHATTLVTNAVIEARGACTGLITTEGFRDVLELRRHMRTHVFDIYGDPAAPLVPRTRRVGVRERVLADGTILHDLNETEVRAAIEHLVELGVTTVAVAFLNSFVNPSHELRVRTILRSQAPHLDVSLSHEVLPLLGEFERTSTTVVNAYAQPLVRSYVSELAASLSERGVKSLNLMASDATLVSSETAIDRPTRIIESGPAAGAVFALSIATRLGVEHVVSFDMGGTTAKVCLIDAGQLPLTSALEVARDNHSVLDGFYRYRKGSGYPVATPSVDLLEIGAGGGSIASLNSLGLIRIGPESAGALPGPACYNAGGERPTVTDANVVLGYISPENFLGGRMTLNVSAAHEAIEREIGRPLGMSTPEAAWRIHDVANEMMAAAIRRQMVEKGAGDDAVTLVAFGGAGPVHAVNLAEKLGLATVVIPPGAGVASAIGLLLAPVAFHVVKAHKGTADALYRNGISQAFADLEREAVWRVRQVEPDDSVALERWIDMRYSGQGFDIKVYVDSNLMSGSSSDLERNFNTAYDRRFGYHYDDVGIEVVNLRCTASTAVGHDSLPLHHWDTHESEGTTQDLWAPDLGVFRKVAAYRRDDLPPDWSIVGPVVIREDESTTVVPAAASISTSPSGSLLISIGRIS